MPSDMNNTSDNNAGRKLSAVVAFRFRPRDLVVPKGIDAGEMLAWASAEELLARHLELASDTKAFWKDGFLLYSSGQWAIFAGLSRTAVVRHSIPILGPASTSSSMITGRRSARRRAAAASRYSGRT